MLYYLQSSWSIEILLKNHQHFDYLHINFYLYIIFFMFIFLAFIYFNFAISLILMAPKSLPKIINTYVINVKNFILLINIIIQ